MNREELAFERPGPLEAREPPEARGLARDGVRLLVSHASGESHSLFRELADWLAAGDLLVVNRSATLPAALPAEAPFGRFRLDLSTDFGGGLWLAEPRWAVGQPGPLPLEPGMTVRAGPVSARAVGVYPGQPRLWFLRFDRDPAIAMAAVGEPIRYGYSLGPFPLSAYQTLFAEVPGSAEMPSAGRPFTARVVRSLEHRGVRLASLLLHTGVSSLEVMAPRFEDEELLPEPFAVGAETVDAVEETRVAGGRVIAVGTTVVRALEAAAGTGRLRPSCGFTRRRLGPGVPIRVVDGLLTGFHDPYASHLALLYALAGADRVRRAYRAAVDGGYLWHEFGDSHLWLPERPPAAN
jgi:S-adenosylmethionine:tRNA ribosyltransferase-isomerase